MHLRPLGHLSGAELRARLPASYEYEARSGCGRGGDPFSTVPSWARKGGLTSRRHPCRLRGGELSEWPKVPDSKSGVPVRVPWVRIPRSPLSLRSAKARGERGNSSGESSPTGEDLATSPLGRDVRLTLAADDQNESHWPRSQAQLPMLFES